MPEKSVDITWDVYPTAMESSQSTSEEQLRLAVDGAQIGTWHWEIAQNTLSWSGTTRRLLGLPDAVEPTYDLFISAIHPDDRDAINRAVNAAIVDRAAYDAEYRAVWPDGSVHWHITRGKCYYDKTGIAQRMEGILIDITERRTAEAELRRSREDLQFATSAAGLGTFYCDWPLDKIIWNDTCKRYFFLPPEAEIDFGVFYAHMHPDDRESTKMAIDRAAADHVEYNVQYRTVGPQGQIRWINAVGRFHYKPDGQPERFDGITIDITVAKTAELELSARARQEALLREIAQAVRTTLDPEEIQKLSVEILGEYLCADRCYVSLIDKPNDIVRIASEHTRAGLPSIEGRYGLSEFGVDPDEYYPGGKTMVVSDVEMLSLPEEFASVVRRLRVRSCIAVPMYDAGQLVATLTVAMADEPRQWTSEEQLLIEAAAAQTRSTVEAARTIWERQTRLERESLINRIGAAVRSSLERETIQSTAVDLLGEALNADRCFYATYNVANDRLTAGKDYFKSPLLSLAGTHKLTEHKHLLDEFFSLGTVAVQDVRRFAPQHISSFLDKAGHRAILAVPVLSGGQISASLFVTMTTPRVWKSDEIALVEQVATMLRGALEMALVSLKEHTISKQLQAALVPEVPNRAPGLELGSYYRPALDEAEVGGDFTDVFSTDDGRTYLVVADMAGKGLAAASQVATVRNMLRYALYNCDSVAGAITGLNRTLAANSLISGFATLFAACFNPTTQILTYVNCGQDPGLLCRREHAEIDQLVATGAVLGLAADTQYIEERMKLHHGDTLALFTDGMTEAGPTRVNMLGVEGVAEKLRRGCLTATCQDIADDLVRQVSEYSMGGTRDDQCLLVARVV